jgi:Rrf2 family protein
MRLELTKRTDLAVRAILQMAKSEGDEPSKGADLADALGTTLAYLPQVMRPLVQAGWVSSLPGPLGGYRLSVSPSSISLLMLIEAVEGPTRDDRCVLRGTACPAEEECAMHGAWARARDALLAELDQTPLSKLR